MPQPLSSKENSLFRQVVKCYESKQYKKGIKAAEQILRKNPNHGDTQAMKALILNSQGNSEEAFLLAKLALKNDMKSHVCWHVYGLLYRSAKNYEEAIKAYKFALRLEPDSQQIQRDLALLQVQMRDYPGYVQSRMTILKARPALRQNWTALAVAHHLDGDLKASERILTTYEQTLKNPPPKTDVEHSEAVLYKNTIIAEMGETERALDHLEAIFKNNLDRTTVMELRAKYLLDLGRMEEAERAYRALLDRNSEYRLYYEGLEKALRLDRSNPESLQALLDMYESYASKSDRIDAARRIPLDFLEGDRFREQADRYLRRMLNKGVPSTFPNIKSLYSNPEKKKVIEMLVLEYASSLKFKSSTEKEVNGEVSDRFEQSVLYFLAQHYNYHLSRHLAKAVEYIDRAIKIDPKSVDYNMTKARIWKHLGNTRKAAEVMNHARQLDEKDRYINTKCAKYQLRNNQNEEALKTMSKFTRNETVGGPLGDLLDMQCMWYITEDGEAYLRQNNLGLALKRFKAIYDIFDVWQEDQFDFHSFSFRKGQVRAYVEMVKWEDHLREHPFYTRAAISAVKTYLMLHDNPDLARGHLMNGIDIKDLDANERKKILKKAKKEQEKAEAERREAERKSTNRKPGTGADGEPKKEDPDPLGKLLLETKNPLTDAQKFLNHLLEFTPRNIESQAAGFEVYIRRRKYLLALKCLLTAHKLDPECPIVHEQAIRLRRELFKLSEPLDSRVLEVINFQFTFLSSSTNLSDYNEAFLSNHVQSVRHVLSGLRMRQLLDSSTQSTNEEALLGTFKLESITFKDAIDGLALLREWRSSKDIRERYNEFAREKWPEATAFEEIFVGLRFRKAASA